MYVHACECMHMCVFMCVLASCECSCMHICANVVCIHVFVCTHVGANVCMHLYVSRPYTFTDGGV